MKTYIALLRGINVSGQKLIKMDALRKALTELDFENVSTYIQSGNILFQSKTDDVKKLEKLIHDLIEKHFGFDVSVIVVTPQDLVDTMKSNPFANDHIELPQPYVSFLSDVPTNENTAILKAIDFQKDRFEIVGKNLYIHYADGAGQTKLSNAVIEKKLKLTSTARNWKTVLKLIELAEAIK
ncbi:DUF1697 domain-containing protein [Flavobacterium caeni]|nr:DUF1697 domain-containing protein [Flavobacterium caeni]